MVQCLRKYEEATRKYRDIQANKPAPLFLSYVEPHKPVSSQRIAHWIKDTLKKAGVDTNKFTAHSVRGASTSAAVGRGLHISDVLKTADWSKESTFRRFYYRPSTTPEMVYAQKVLSTSENQGH